MLLLCSTCILDAMVFDNRFMPLFQKPYLTTPCYPSHFRIEGFFGRATQAYDNNGEDIPLPLVFGLFDQAQLARSMITAGFENPFTTNPSWVLGSIPWTIEGKLQAQGFALAYHQELGYDFAFGLYTIIMHVNSRQEFFLNNQDNNVRATEQELEIILRSMFKTLNLTCGYSEQFGPGDLELYLAYENCWDYIYKMRHIDVQVRLGALVATGIERDLCKPTSISFGGNGHYGIYGSAQGIFEVKEDLSAGLFLRVSKRFVKTQLHRLPVDDSLSTSALSQTEPAIFGATLGQARVNPGVTVIFSPFVYAENLRGGLGVAIQYWLTSHQKDNWCDARADKSIPINLEQVQRLSAWGSDYISLSAFYDFGQGEQERGFKPITYVTWDIPTSWFVAHNVFKTIRVTLGIDFNF
jgi:hypothetical protein